MIDPQPTEQECSYCHETFAYPVAYHHSQEECDETTGRTVDTPPPAGPQP